jgi:hypothetical protein
MISSMSIAFFSGVHSPFPLTRGFDVLGDGGIVLFDWAVVVLGDLGDFGVGLGFLGEGAGWTRVGGGVGRSIDECVDWLGDDERDRLA